MKIVYFTHSLVSCWNHGNAHFLRGVLRELKSLGHTVEVFEPADGWSASNLVADHGDAGLDAFRRNYPELSSTSFGPDADPAELALGADLVIVHEWNDHKLVARLGEARRRGAPYTLLFHDTHHRAVTAPAEMRAYDLSAYDGVLAFGEALAEVYRAWGWGRRVFVWHEAADTRLFRPPERESPREGLVWIGNWGDGERTRELEQFLLAPARASNLALDIYGVRYPTEALGLLERYGARYHGWLPNPSAPDVFARHRATVHVPRGPYARALPGIPTIRVFEALACGIPLLSAPWNDAEGLFRDGDFAMARDGEEMMKLMKRLLTDPEWASAMAASGLETIRARHTCAHRARELVAIAQSIRQTEPA